MKILLAIDHSGASQKAIHFVARVFGSTSPDDLKITVFHVWESRPDFLTSQQSEVTDADAAEWPRKAKQQGQDLLSAAKATLVKADIPESAVETKLVQKDALPESKHVVAVLTLLDELERGDYDVACVGRRGGTYASGSFIGSVAEKVLREAEGRTVWVVD